MVGEWDILIEKKIESFNTQSEEDVLSEVGKFTDTLSPEKDSTEFVLNNIEELFVTMVALGLWSYINHSDRAFIVFRGMREKLMKWHGIMCDVIQPDEKKAVNDPILHKATLIFLRSNDWIDAIKKIEQRAKLYKTTA